MFVRKVSGIPYYRLYYYSLAVLEIEKHSGWRLERGWRGRRGGGGGGGSVKYLYFSHRRCHTHETVTPLGGIQTSLRYLTV